MTKKNGHSKGWYWFVIIGTFLFIVKGIQWFIRYNLWAYVIFFGGFGIAFYVVGRIWFGASKAAPPTRSEEQNSLDEEEEMYVIDNTRTHGENKNWFDDYQ